MEESLIGYICGGRYMRVKPGWDEVVILNKM